jgi:hypothetical protein
MAGAPLPLATVGENCFGLWVLGMLSSLKSAGTILILFLILYLLNFAILL